MVDRMAGSSQQSAAPSDNYFDDDEDFVQALMGVGDQFSPSKEEAAENAVKEEEEIPHVNGGTAERGDGKDQKGEMDVDLPPTPEKQAYMETDAYKPNAFGDFASYMKNKRKKLKVQEESMTENEARAAAGSSQPSKDYATFPPLFKGTNIYINGHTNPPYAELRRLLHLYGGSLLPYLDQKTPCTHIIASNLTAKKRIEFKDYKVVRPEWVTESIAQSRRLNWRDFQCAEDASGAMKMGALQGRLRVGVKAGLSRITEEAAERTRRLAAQGDWRMIASQDPNALTPFNKSGSGPGKNVGGIGPWGKSSRQKTLAGWGQKEEDVPSSQSETERPDSVEKEEEQPKRSQSEEAWLENLETPPKPKSKDDQIITPIRDNQARDDDKIFPSLGTDPPSAAAAAAAGHSKPSHPYALRPSNIAAAKLLASPSWRERNTATSDEFLAGYFQKSRLHHLSTWKSEMKEMVSQALRESGKEQGSVDLPKGVQRVIMHIDFDAFFVSVGLRNRPDLHQKAVVVCHGTSTQEGSNNGTIHSTSEIASCNYIARTFGISNGMSLGQANRLCKDVHTIPYDFSGYNDVAIQFYTILLLHADALEAVSIDEALIDVSLLLEEMRSGTESELPERRRLLDHYKDLMNSQGVAWTEEKRLAEALRDEIRGATGCEASIGIGDNVLLARMATRKAKPGGSFYLKIDDFPEFAADLDVDDLHGIGWSIRNRCRDVFSTAKIGELTEQVTKGKFIAEFGDKQGVTIWDKLHGRERDRLEEVKPRQSCGASINYAIRFETDQEAKAFVVKLSQEVSNRLQAIKLVGKICSISIMARSKDAPIEAPKFLGHGVCDTFNRSAPFSRPTDDKDVIFALAWKLISALNIKADQLRGIGVSCQKLQSKEASNRASAGQGLLNFLSEKKPRQDTLVKESPLHEDASDGEEDEPLEPGPSGVTRRRRSITPEAEVIAPKSSGKAVELPMSTQFVIPPASQLDPDVISALPEKIQAQIRSVQQKGKASTSTTRALSAEPALYHSPVKSVAASTPEKHRTPVNPFLSMRAASTTPTKRTLKQSQPLRTPYEMPRLSQIDPEVLAALPEDVREEILREAGGSMSTRSSKVASAVPAFAASEMMARRASSDSPRKKQRFLDASTSKLLGAEPPRTPSKLIQRYDATDAAIAIVAASKKLPARAMDPKTVTEQDLIQLEIDVGFFKALPEQVQREILLEQAKLVNDKQARFKSGKQIQELSLKEERRLQTQAAFAFDEDTGFRAQLTVNEGLHPNLKGQHTLFQIRQLLDSWYGQYETSGPRQKDVDRFARFLVECVEMVDLDQLEKVRGVLKWWSTLLQQSEKGMVHDDWFVAFAKVKEKVNAIVRVKFGAVLSLK
jgi:DNA repair protein REV1